MHNFHRPGLKILDFWQNDQDFPRPERQIFGGWPKSWLQFCYDWAMRDFGDDVFEGTAKYYAKYRPCYPQALLDEIVKTFKLDGRGKLLDLGCGTGELAIPLAKYFTSVKAIDPDKDMLEQGREKTNKAHITNIMWQKGSSKDLSRLEEQFLLVTMGSSFHWMEQELVLNELYNLIRSDGGVAIIGGAKPLEFSSTKQKDKIIQEVINKYLGEERRAGKYIYTHPEKSFESFLQESRFRDFKEHYYTVKLNRNIDEIIGLLFSSSFVSKKQLGKKAKAFETELRQKLSELPVSNFVEKLKFSLFTAIK